MNKFQKLNRAEMKKVNGGVWVIIGCQVHCTDHSDHPTNTGLFSVDSCDPNYVSAICMGSEVDWCACQSEPIN